MSELTVPSMDFSTLGELGNIYRKANADQARQQTLSSLGQGVGPDSNALLRSGDLSLAQLGVAMRNRSSDDIWRQQEAARAQQNADRSYGIQERAQNRADEGVPEKAADRAKAAASYGLTPDNPAYKPFVLAGQIPATDTSFQTTIEQRKQAATANGLATDSPGFQSYVLTGKMPREDAQPLTATDKKAILEADEHVQATQGAITNLQQAKKLSKAALSGPMADKMGYAASFFGDTSEIGKAGIATTDLNNLVTTNALSQLKTIFGGNPTEGERGILLSIQGSANQPDKVRQKIYDRAIELANKRLEFNKQRADELRGGQFYKAPGAKGVTPPPGAQAVAPAVPAPPQVGEIRDGWTFKGGNPGDQANWSQAGG